MSELNDPLSDPDKCARDIILFQELGINTIRIYSINAHLNHDKCMTMLAKAGIYLFLDVNSPLPHHHLNRYEPWNSYNLYYFENVFKVVEQFSHYNNTLGLLPGTKLSTTPSPPVWLPHMSKRWSAKSKSYIEYNAPEPSRRLFSGRRLELSNASSTVPRVWRRQPQRISRLLWRQLVPVVWRPDILQQRVQHLGQRLQTFHQTNVFRNMGAMRYCREISMKSQYCTQTI